MMTMCESGGLICTQNETCLRSDNPLSCDPCAPHTRKDHDLEAFVIFAAQMPILRAPLFFLMTEIRV